MDRKREEQLIDYLGILGMVFFVIWGIVALVTKDTEFIFDRFFSAFMIFLVWSSFKKMQLQLPELIVALFALVLHHLKLYGNFYLGIPFDRIMHAIAGFAFALIAYRYLSSVFEGRHSIGLFVFSVFFAFGIASSIEIIEFVGYSLLGEGEGVLFYGTGDFGEWNNLSWDLIGNMIGSVLGSLTMAGIIKKK